MAISTGAAIIGALVDALRPEEIEPMLLTHPASLELH